MARNFSVEKSPPKIFQPINPARKGLEIVAGNFSVEKSPPKIFQPIKKSRSRRGRNRGWKFQRGKIAAKIFPPIKNPARKDLEIVARNFSVEKSPPKFFSQ